MLLNATRVEKRSGKTLTVTILIFFGNGKSGRENENDITGYREQNILVGNLSITIRNR